jgi:outer membrane receptor protein involved in Fe transport
MWHRSARLGSVAAALSVSTSFTIAADAPPAATSPSAPEEIEVVAKRLGEARINIEPRIGASTYTVTKEAIEAQPGGENLPIDQVILQAPGVNQDNLANGGLHVRNEHLNVQYRIDGIILPDGVTFFGQSLAPRYVSSLQLITGALPAEYGLRTAGIVDIQTKTGGQQGGEVGLYGGSFGTFNPSFDYGTAANGWHFFVSGDYLLTDHGVDGVTDKYHQIHDAALESHAFLYLDKIIDSSSKIGVIGGTFNARFEIPNNPGQTPFFAPAQTINGVPVTAFNSAKLDEKETEAVYFGVVSYLRSEQAVDFQLSSFTKYSSLEYHPDPLGDLVFTGVSEQALRSSFANGIQADAAWRVLPDHTLRAGTLISIEHVLATTDSTVLPVMGAGFGSTPIVIPDDSEKTGYSYSVYLQDEWRLRPDLTVNYGGRFDVVNGYTTGNQISPRVNTVWQPMPGTTFHAGYASYFTPPPLELVSTRELALFAGTSAGPLVTTNSPIKNERAHYFDVGAIQKLTPDLTVGLDTYYKYSRNLLDEGQFASPVILTPFNYHAGYNRGVELTTAYSKDGFNWYGNLAFAEQKAKDIDSAQFNFTPSDLNFIATNAINTDHSQLLTASAGISYLWHGTRFSTDLLVGSGVRTTRLNGPPNGGTVPTYEQVNFGVSHRFEDAPGGPITVRLDLINALDQVYLLRSQTGIGVFANQFGPRRSLFAGIKKEF